MSCTIPVSALHDARQHKDINKGISAVMIIAKVAVPACAEGVERARLFQLLDGSSAPVIWIGAAPGSGKTTLAASYARARSEKNRIAWLHVDAEDADPTVFFHYLALAVSATVKRRKSALPVADPAQRGQFAAFARRFARRLFEALGEGGMLVLDNVHELTGPENEALLAALAEEVPDGVRLILLSHTAPSSSFAPLVARQRLLELDGDDLKLDAAETAALHTRLGARGGWSHEQLHAMTQGWAAGVVLLANANAESVSDDAITDAHTLFDYFGAVAVGRLPERCVEILIYAAMMHAARASAIDALTGGDDAARWLDHARSQGLFVDRREDSRVGRIYSMHPLFRAFLRNHAKRSMESSVWKARLGHVAQLEAAQGYVENAVRLLKQAGKDDAALTVLLEAAPTLVKEARLTLLLDLIESFRETQDAWLLYWKGLALTHVDERLARGALETAFALHKADGQRIGQLLCAAAIAEFTVQHFASFRDIERWQAVVNELYSPDLAFADAEQELRAITGVLAANLVLSDDVERMEPLMQRCEVLVAQDLDPNQRLAAASFVITFFDQLPGQYVRATQFIHLANAVAKSPGVTDLRRATLLYWLASFYVQAYKIHLRGPDALKACHKVLEELKTIGEANDFHESRFTYLWLTADLEMYAGNLEGAEERMDAAEAFLKPTQPVLAMHFFMTRSHLAMHRGNALKALAHARHGVEIAEHAGIPETVVAKVRYTEAQVRLPLRQFEEARAAVGLVIACARPAYADLYRIGLLGIRALEALAVGVDAGDDADAYLRDFFAQLRESNRIGILQLVPGEVAKLCAAALERGIEGEHASRMVRQRKLEAPPGAPIDWPWRVVLRTLGPFELLLDGEPLKSTGKTQRKPLDLLKALAARGEEAYSGVNATRLADELWPELDVEDNRASLHTTLHRARKLLGSDDALIHADGKVSFDARFVWCDTAAFRECARAIGGLPAEIAPSAGQEVRQLARRLLALARGTFLEDDDARWAAIARERLSAAFVTAVERCGAALESVDAADEALALYEQGLRHNPLVEAFYRAQMRVLLTRGEKAAALVAYRRCREQLSIVLGVTPAAETEALYRRSLATT
jgi:LuxR family maltose regulon positive regulatory protein